MAAVPDEVAARLEADLSGPFPGISVRFAKADDGSWVCRIEDRGDLWGEASTSYEVGVELSPTDIERLLAEVTLEVADNLWPDDLTDPWPVCPSHGDHPLQVQFAAGSAAWVCLRDSVVVIPVGSLQVVGRSLATMGP